MAQQITITLETEGAAFEGEEGPREAGRILANIAAALQNDETLVPQSFTQQDINGNTVVHVRVENGEF